MSEEFDFTVIGGGSAGYNAAATAVKLGLKTAVIEGGEEIGGLCILRGCMPSKALIESANRFTTLKRAEEFGLRAENIGVDGEKIFARKERLVAEFAAYRRQQLETAPFAFIRGWAAFADPNTLTISTPEGARTLRSKTFLIATGSKSTRLPIPGLEETGCLDSDAVLAKHTLPASIIVLGAGATGLEFAHYYASLGTRVTILQRSGQVLRDTDPDVAKALSDALQKRGIAIIFNTAIQSVSRVGNLKRINFLREGAPESVEAEEIIYALGREPNFDGLGLENAGIPSHRNRLLVTSHQQTSVPHIFAAGDAAGPFEIVHIAIQQGELAARNAARMIRQGGDLESLDYRLKLFVIFTKPEVAAVGWTEKELISAGVDFRTASYGFSDHGKSLILGETDGFVKLITASAGGEILGAAVVGPSASELIHEMVVAMHFRATTGELLRVPHYHPTLSEIWTYPAEELA